MVDFAGWKMPVQYASIVEEHLATRHAAGLFDVSHMGRLSIGGPQSLDWLESLLTRRVVGIEVGQSRYSLIASSDDVTAGVQLLDDAIVSRESDASGGGGVPAGSPRMGLVVNASNRQRVVAWLTKHLPDSHEQPTKKSVTLVDRTLDTAMIAVQGPLALKIICSLCSAEDAERIGQLHHYRATPACVADQSATVSRTGYTGEDGLEIVVAADVAVHVWEAIHSAGTPLGLMACGLGARDTLRLEAGMPLYGHELREDSDPFAVGLGLAVTLEGRSFPGADRFADLRAQPTSRIRVGLEFDSKRSAREGDAVYRQQQLVGVVTSGSFAPSLGRAVAMAMVDRNVGTLGMSLDVLVRDARHVARVVSLPFYRRPKIG